MRRPQKNGLEQPVLADKRGTTMSGSLVLRNSQDEAYLLLFHEVVAGLRRRSILRRTRLLKWSMEWRPGRKVQFRHHLHDHDRITALLTDVRKLHLVNEPLHLTKVFTWARARIADPARVAELDNLRREYKAGLGGASVAIGEHGETYSRRQLLDIYLNGEYFHTEPEKRALIKELEARHLMFPRVLAMEGAVSVAHAALALAGILERARNDAK